jgi:putative membrane protein
MPFTAGFSSRYRFSLLLLVVAVFIWSAIQPYDRATWWMEVAPVVIAVPLLILTYRRFPLTSLLYGLIAVHCVILLVGGHYTYARVPLFDELRDLFGWQRNHYDRLGHLAQGFVPAMIGRELLLRTSPLKPGRWLFILLVLSCLGISALYELIEWAAAALTGEAAMDFLGTQGDVWDSQKDMLMAGVGAILGLATLSRWHDCQLAPLKNRH